jgi:hypothetical protein
VDACGIVLGFSAACVKKCANFRSMCEKVCEFPQHV